MQTSLLSDATSDAERFTLQTVKSWTSFRNYLEEAQRMRVVSYCDSPKLVLKMFDDFELDAMELVAGNAEDYRERLTSEDAGLVDRLERLKREGRLTIYTCPTKTVHSKIYLLDLGDDTFRLMTGSANFTTNSWTNHTNHLAIFETGPESAIYEAFQRDYQEHRDAYGTLFLEDLTTRLDESETDRTTVIQNWVAGRSSTRDAVEEINMKLAQQALAQDPSSEDASGEDASGEDASGEDASGQDISSDREIHLSLRGFEADVQKTVKEEFQSLGGQVGPDSASIDTGGLSRFLNRQFGIPGLWVGDSRMHYAPPGQPKRILSTPVPSDPEPIDAALSHLESYLGTVDTYGQTNEPEAVKAHMLETLLYFFWAPLVNEHARMFERRNVPNLDKRLPFLYLQGESNSGKGTLLEFGLRLISQGTVTAPIDADEVGRKQMRGLRHAHSSFPLAVDDIEKSKIHRLDPLRNYWTRWDEKSRFPTLIFTSNDRRPQKWFRNRAKTLSLDVLFTSTPEAEAEVQTLIETDNPLFEWIAHRMLEGYQSGTLSMDADVLSPVRTILFELYDRAGRSVPPYLNDEPAEERYDPGRRAWRRMAEDGQFTIKRRQDALHLQFDEEIQHWTIAEFRRQLPVDVRATQEGHRILIRAPDRFEEWLGGMPSGGLWGQLKSLLRGGSKSGTSSLRV